MRIKYLGHASFVITTSSETRILTDPYSIEAYADKLLYSPIEELVDVVTVSHGHGDHGDPKALVALPGAPVIIKSSGKFLANGVEFLGVETFHDDSHGGERGKNIVFVINADDLYIAHLGDLGHVLTADQAAEIGAVDVVLVPVGGFYTIDAAQATKVVDQLGARVVIPMHYRTRKCLFPIADVEEFLAGKENVVRAGTSDLDVTKDSPPTDRQVVVLDQAL